MNELTVFEKNGQLLTDSREVATMVGKRHTDLLRDIRQYCDYFTESNFGFSDSDEDNFTERNFASSDFFIQSSYLDSTGRTLPCYLLTKKGCDMVANKMTGQKGVLFTAAYVTAFENMKEHIENGTPLPDTFKQSLAEAKLLNARARVSSQWLKISQQVDIPEYKQICASYASSALAGTPAIPLPVSEEKHYTAGEIGEMFGLSAQKIGKLANERGLKIEEFGKWYHDKSRYSCKQVDTFKYNMKAIEKFKDILFGSIAG